MIKASKGLNDNRIHVTRLFVGGSTGRGPYGVGRDGHSAIHTTALQLLTSYGVVSDIPSSGKSLRIRVPPLRTEFLFRLCRSPYATTTTNNGNQQALTLTLVLLSPLSPPFKMEDIKPSPCFDQDLSYLICFQRGTASKPAPFWYSHLLATMGLYKQLPDNVTEVDIIIAGGMYMIHTSLTADRSSGLGERERKHVC